MLSGGCPLARRVTVDAVDVYARGAIDRIAHRIDVEFSGHAVFGAEYGHELDAGRFGENIDRPAALHIETSLVGDNTDCAWGRTGWNPGSPGSHPVGGRRCRSSRFHCVGLVHAQQFVAGRDDLRKLRCSILRAAIWRLSVRQQ